MGSPRDRSAAYDGTIPQEWGPGPWDYESRGWAAAAYRSGDIRAWGPGDPLDRARLPLTVRHGLTGVRRSARKDRHGT